MQLALPLIPDAPAYAARPAPVVSAPPLPAPTPAVPVPPAIEFVRRRGARRYILRVMDDGTLRVTVPYWGSRREARQFADAQGAWVARQRAQRAGRSASQWSVGATVLVDGVAHAIADLGEGRVAVAGDVLPECVEPGGDAGRVVRTWLRQRAVACLPGELAMLAARHDIPVTRVSIRDQKSRWGSCSRRGTISLNWRLVQTPPFVREYVLLHELMHRRELNHSARFWRLVAAACPRYVEARKWLREDGASLF
ncbi:MAG TPA: SprT family zinc-dependent metalloprotease [Vicinamibacterales bacterium]|nr:SprT family zinc-dependent metalloprotease [Vicinamibacterales bacterium]